MQTPTLPTGTVLVGADRRQTASLGVAEHVNPATGRVQASFPIAGPDEVDSAATAATVALAEWRDWRPVERRRALDRVAQLLRQHSEELSAIASLENGMPFLPLQGLLAAEWFEYVSGWCDRLEGQVFPEERPGVVGFTRPEPLGVVGIILTWNGPVIALGMCVAPALAAGCTVLIKPSEKAPFSAMRFGELCLEAGLPPGVVNVLPGSAETGEALVRHPSVAKVGFTGGTVTARKVASACAASLKPTVFELGGKSANIVYADADLDVAVASAASFTRLSGQICTLPSRLLVEEPIYEEFIARLTDTVDQVVVGDPFAPGTAMGPVIDAAACTRILGMIDQAKQEGAEIVLGGERLGGPLAEGFFVAPTVATEVDNASRLAQEEVFGPVLATTRFTGEDEAVALANHSDYGLAAYVHTGDGGKALRTARRLSVGSVAINEVSSVSTPNAPFGGVKASGYGVEGGLAGVLEFVHMKNVQYGTGS